MDKISTTGVIDQTIYSDGGNVMYIVNVELNGNIVKAQSIHYSSKTKSLPNGKKVSVNYWETPKGRNRLVEILDENIVPCKDDLSGDLRLLASFGILVIIVICIFTFLSVFIACIIPCIAHLKLFINFLFFFSIFTPF